MQISLPHLPQQTATEYSRSLPKLPFSPDSNVLNPDTRERSPNLISIKEVIKRCGLCRSTIYWMIKQGEFPKPYSIGARAVRFSDLEIDEWINKRLGK